MNYDTEHSSVDERVLRFHRSILSEGMALIILIFLIAVGPFLTIDYPFLVQHIDLAFGYSLPLPLLGLPGLLTVFFVIHRRFNYLYVIDHDHVGSIKGILSTRLQDVRIEYENIRGVEIDRTLYQRALDLGDIKVGSAMHADVEVWMGGVRHPHLYRSIIEARMREHIHKYRSVSPQNESVDTTSSPSEEKKSRRRLARSARKVKLRPKSRSKSRTQS